jgi:hypothetical protein
LQPWQLQYSCEVSSPRQKLSLSTGTQQRTGRIFVVTPPFLAKFPTVNNIAFLVEGQSTVLGKVTFLGKAVILGNIAFLGKVPTLIITSIMLVSLPVALALSPLYLCIAASIALASSTLLQWLCFRCSGITLILALASAQS